ncbi:hypothetical protein lbkm_2453 [Lachnospiraceae bacterium KM106-2]|nr:hypothetical protein lbkm_2453 [Lachnospiraceae bacterium KM106-2]
MKTLYLDCGMGAAGDMISAALYELLEDKDTFIKEINSLGIPNVVITAEKIRKCGIVGTHMKVTINGIEEGTMLNEHEHHENNHNHEHHHSMHDMEHIIASLPLSEEVKSNSISIYKMIAEAESHAHGVPVTDIHFHEVGTMDAIADIVAVCLLMKKLNIKKVFASPIHVGSGHVHCAHGILPVPAPATAYILKQVPIYGGKIKGELCTPTGAALLKYFVTTFGEMPVMTVDKIGYGMGVKDFETVNCVRAMLGETSNNTDEILELSCNLDDMTPECIGYAMERLFDADALDVYTVPIGMKKNRPGTLLCVMCKSEKKEDMIRLIFKYTTTLGIRETIHRRYTLNRADKSITTPYGNVGMKHSWGYGVIREKYEYNDLAQIAREQNLSIEDTIRMVTDCK